MDPRPFSWRQINLLYAGKVQHDWTLTASLRMDMRTLKGVKTQWWQVNPLEKQPRMSAFQAARERWKNDG